MRSPAAIAAGTRGDILDCRLITACSLLLYICCNRMDGERKLRGETS